VKKQRSRPTCKYTKRVMSTKEEDCQEQHSYPVVTVKEEPLFESFESPTDSISSSALDPINTIETNTKEIDVFVFGEYGTITSIPINK